LLQPSNRQLDRYFAAAPRAGGNLDPSAQYTFHAGSEVSSHSVVMRLTVLLGHDKVGHATAMASSLFHPKLAQPPSSSRDHPVVPNDDHRIKSRVQDGS
jgi:hypothetical protein